MKFGDEVQIQDAFYALAQGFIVGRETLNSKLYYMVRVVDPANPEIASHIAYFLEKEIELCK